MSAVLLFCRKYIIISQLLPDGEANMSDQAVIAGAESGNRKNQTKKAVKIGFMSVVIVIAAGVLSIVALFIHAAVVSERDMAEKYRPWLIGDEVIDEAADGAPKEQGFIGRYAIRGDEPDFYSASKKHLICNDKEYYIYDGFRMYSDVYDAVTNEKAAELWEMPCGLFKLDDFIYYGYGKERIVWLFHFHNLEFYDLRQKNFKFARLNLKTMENEAITKEEYEEAYDYMEFWNWDVNTTEPVKSLDVFVWLDHDYKGIGVYGEGYGYNGEDYEDDNYATYYTLKNGDLPKEKDKLYEYFIYHIEPSYAFGQKYAPPQYKTNSIAELNAMIAKFPDTENITIYNMNRDIFSDEEMAAFADNIIVLKENCVKTVTVW